MSNRSSIRVVVAALVALGTALASCSGSSFGRDDAADAGRPWAHEAEDLFGGVARELSEGERSGRVIAALLLSVAAVTSASCSERGPAARAVTISVDLEAGQRWTAQGPAVDRDMFCGSGIRHVLDGIDPVTNEIVPVRVWSEIVNDAMARRNTTEITLVVEHTCSDGSGSFVTREQWGPDIWSVEVGTGAHRELAGGGTLSFATLDYMQIAPLRLSLDGMVGS